VALQEDYAGYFAWPEPLTEPLPSVGEALYDQMAAEGWRQVDEWKAKARKIAPTLVGGSKKHGGPDLGPTRARKAWADMGVNGKSIAETPPGRDFEGMPRLTVSMTASL
jgi:DNA (cytosine-5)-methyltransferase 1